MQLGLDLYHPRASELPPYGRPHGEGQGQVERKGNLPEESAEQDQEQGKVCGHEVQVLEQVFEDQGWCRGSGKSLSCI